MSRGRTYEDVRDYMIPYLREYRRTRRRTDPKYAEDMREAKRKFRREHPEIHRAHESVRRAIKAGRLVRPEICQRCGDSGSIEASHDDYEKRLEVEWLCRSCHRLKDKCKG